MFKHYFCIHLMLTNISYKQELKKILWFSKTKISQDCLYGEYKAGHKQLFVDNFLYKLYCKN